jgi:hypothetical protein
MAKPDRGRMPPMLTADAYLEQRIRVPPLRDRHLHERPHTINIEHLEGVILQRSYWIPGAWN